MSTHTMPLNDEREHFTSMDCWCEPRVIWIDPDTNLPWAQGGYLAVHHAADCRELAEGDGESMAPGKAWEVVEI